MRYPSPTDLAEMKARGYDPPTIAETPRQSERWFAAEQVCQAIDTAFAGVTLGGGVGLREAQGLDDYADATTCASYRADEEKDDWHRISADALNLCHSRSSFFDAEGMRFHLPAYLRNDLRGEFSFGTVFCLTHRSDHSRRQFALLSSAQRAAVRAFLSYTLDEPDEELHRAGIVRALAESWTDTTRGHL